MPLLATSVEGMVAFLAVLRDIIGQAFWSDDEINILWVLASLVYRTRKVCEFSERVLLVETAEEQLNQLVSRQKFGQLLGSGRSRARFNVQSAKETLVWPKLRWPHS